MAFLIAILFIGLLGKVVHNTEVFGKNFRLIALSEFSALLFGPTIYLFTSSVLEKKYYTFKRLVHYIPGFMYSVFILIYFIIPSDAIIIERSKTGELMRVIYMCHAVGLIVNLTYWFLSWSIFKNFSKKMKNEISYEIQNQFLFRFLIIIGCCLFIWSVLYITSLLGIDMIERKARPYIWIVLTLIILFITYYSMISPQVLQIIPEELENKKYNKSKLSYQDLNTLKHELELIMIEKKPYLNSKLLKSELAQLLGVNNPELARLLNENIGMNFFEYVNYYRIKEFVTLAQTEKAKQFTFFGLAQESGFHSKTTFNKSFKKLMGSSPSEYFNKNLQ
ncbi:AraC family transcriptional regulator [Tenacibaculum pelagium]|nr:helix-turn-helix domain-containing protein [Tenacibaculum pelagium]